MILHTPRLALRPLGPNDAALMHAMWTDPHVRKYLWDDEVISEEVARSALVSSAQDFDERGYGLWGILERETGELAGFCGLRASGEPAPELLYGLLARWCGRGLATEAARAVLAHAFLTLGVHEVVAATDVPNTASARLMERIGMRFERRGVLNGLDTVFYRLSRDEYERR